MPRNVDGAELLLLSDWWGFLCDSAPPSQIRRGHTRGSGCNIKQAK